MANLFSASEAALGYLYQCRLALFESLRRARALKGDAVALEAFDDIHFEDRGTPTELLQSKHRVVAGNLSDASADIWKTVRAWLSFHEVNNAAFGDVELYLVTTQHAQPDTIASSLGVADRNERRAADLLTSVAESSTADDTQEGAAAYLALTDEDRRAFVGSITVLTGSPTIEDLRTELANELRLHVLPQFLMAFVSRVEGWWFQECIASLANSEIIPISFTALNEAIVELARKFDEDNLPVDLEFPDRDEQYDQDTFIFVQQLRAIGMANTVIDIAVRNYFRAFQSRSRWQREDLLLVGELGRYERQLVEEWEHLFALMQTGLGETPTEDKARAGGFELYSKLHDMHIPIRPKVNERSVYRGSLHMLADELTIGWHCSFKDRLQHLLGVAAT